MSLLKNIAIIGYGGFAREITCALKEGSYSYFINKQFINEQNKAHVKPLENINIDKYKVMIAVGDPLTRKKLVGELPNADYMTYVNEHSILLDPKTIKIGKGAIITAGSILTTNIKLGEFSHINLNNTIGHDVVIGNYFTTAPSVSISGNCTIGNNVYIGTGAVIRDKITICDNVVIGMNSVVTKNITEPGTYVGIPSKKIN